MEKRSESSGKTYYKEGNCIWSFYRRPVKGEPLEGFKDTWHEERFEARFDFDFPPSESGSPMSLADYLEEYAGKLAPVSEKWCVKKDTAPKHVEECETCELKQSCPIREDRHCETKISAELDFGWVEQCKPYGMQYYDMRKIQLRDIRWNNRPVKLIINRPRYISTAARLGTKGDPEASISVMDIHPIQFFSHRVTTRAAASIAKLYNNYSEKLICEGYKIGTTQFRNVIREWREHCRVETWDSDTHFIIYDLLKGTPVVFVLNAEQGTLVAAYKKKDECFKYSHVRALTFWKTGDSTREPMVWTRPELTVMDVYEYLHRLFQHSNPGDDVSCRNLTQKELLSILESSFYVLKDVCTVVESQLRSGIAGRNAAEEQLFRQLKTLSVLADTPSAAGQPLFPELVRAIGEILDGSTSVNLFPYYYMHRREEKVFTLEACITLEEFEEFLEEVNRNMPDDADIDLALSRLTTFNEPATAVVSYDEEQDCYAAESVFSKLTLNDFYQLHVPIRPVPLPCLTHLVRCGMLDTEAPILDLPCVQNRLQNKQDAGCKIRKCPLLSQYFR